jgi:Glycosyl-transferase family 4
MLKITLVSHTDTLTGAPKLLMDLADLLVENGFLVTFVVKNATKSGLLSLRTTFQSAFFADVSKHN